MEYNHEKNNLQSVTKNDNNENLSQKEKNEMCIFGKKKQKKNSCLNHLCIGCFLYCYTRIDKKFEETKGASRYH